MLHRMVNTERGLNNALYCLVFQANLLCDGRIRGSLGQGIPSTAKTEWPGPSQLEESLLQGPQPMNLSVMQSLAIILHLLQPSLT